MQISQRKSQNGIANVPPQRELEVMLRDCRPVTFQDAIMSPTPKLERIVAVRGELAASALVAATLIEIASLMSFSLSEAMIEAAADSIVQRWPDVRISDLKLFKSKVLSGEIGGTIYRLDARGLCVLFDEYYQKRFEVLEGMLERKNSAGLRPVNDGVLTNEQVKKAYENMKHQAIVDRNTKKYQDMVKKMNLMELCDSEGLDPEDVMAAIRVESETEFADAGLEMTFETYLSVKVAKYTTDARKNAKILHDLCG